MKHLTLAQRYALEAYIECGKSKSETSLILGVDRSTIYREIKCNSLTRGAYNSDFVNELVEERKERFVRNINLIRVNQSLSIIG